MDKTKVFKICIFFIFVVAIIGLTFIVFPVFKNIFTPEGRIEFQNEIQNLGIKGMLVILGLMLVQTFLLFLPIEPVEVLAGMCYGGIGGMLLIYVGAILTTTIVYFFIKKYGRKFLYSIISKDKIEKIENSDFWRNSKKVDIALFIAYFIPGTPKGLLTYIGALLPINFGKFLFIIMLARFPEIISSTIVGNSILFGNWPVIITAYFVTFIISGIVFYFYNLMSKKKSLEK